MIKKAFLSLLIAALLATGTPAWAIDTDGTLSANSDTRIPSQKAVKTYADTKATFSSGVFASKPGSPTTGQLYFATDLGTGVLIEYTGSKWKPVGGKAVIYHTGVQGTVLTGGTGATNVGSYTVPAGLLSANGGLVIRTLWGALLTNGTKSTQIKLSASAAGDTSGTNIYSVAHASSTLSVQDIRVVSNRNSASSQVSSSASVPGGAGATTGANVTTSINTANVWYINFVGTLGSALDSMYLDMITIEWVES